MSEADLENMLLEAAGRTGASRRSKSHQLARRRHKGSYSDDESDSKDDSDDGHPGRKPSGSQVPLKKRSKNRDDDQGSQDDEDKKNRGSDRESYSSDDSDVGSDLYKDENDREELSKLTELEREMILSDRAAKKDDRKLHKQMRSKLTSEKKSQSSKDTPPVGSSRGLRTSIRYADRVAAKADALKELKARRLKRDSEGKQRLSSEHSGSRGYSPEKRKGATASSSSSGSDNGSDSHSDDEGSIGDGRMDYSDDERDKTVSDIPTYEDIKKITIKRSKLAKWFMEPFFEELIVGCFVRVGIGTKAGQNIYRLCMVQNVDASDPNKRYQLENKTTYKYLNCVWGHDRSAARWQMARTSDSPPTLEEFNEWSREVNRTGGRMPRRKDVVEKQEALDRINNYVYSAETVKQMLQEKKSASARPMNIAAEKEKLRRELDIAEYREDEAEIQRIKTRLRELEAARQNHKLDDKALRLSEMNRKNRAENFRVSSLRAADRSLNPGDAGYDPFSRRWTRSRNYYAKQEGGTVTTGEGTAEGGVKNYFTNDVVASDGGDSKGVAKPVVETGVTATEAALVAAAGAGKLVDTKAPVDQESNVLHNFELPISLSLLQKFGGAYGAGAGFLARKQRIEATIGCQVPKDDGRRHPMTLSVGDYKRRRGLL